MESTAIPLGQGTPQENRGPTRGLGELGRRASSFQGDGGGGTRDYFRGARTDFGEFGKHEQNIIREMRKNNGAIKDQLFGCREQRTQLDGPPN